MIINHTNMHSAPTAKTPNDNVYVYMRWVRRWVGGCFLNFKSFLAFWLWMWHTQECMISQWWLKYSNECQYWHVRHTRTHWPIQFKSSRTNSVVIIKWKRTEYNLIKCIPCHFTSDTYLEFMHVNSEKGIDHVRGVLARFFRRKKSTTAKHFTDIQNRSMIIYLYKYRIVMMTSFELTNHFNLLREIIILPKFNVVL